MLTILFFGFSIQRHASGLVLTGGFALGLAACLAAPARSQGASSSAPAQSRQPTYGTVTGEESCFVGGCGPRHPQTARGTAAARDRLHQQQSPTAGGVSVVGQRSRPSVGNAANGEGKLSGANSKDNEAYWRQRFSKVRTKLQQVQEALGIMQRELGELNVQYYPNPRQALAQSITRSDINAKVEAIAAKKADIASLQQRLSDMEDALRKSGGDPGWARE